MADTSLKIGEEAIRAEGKQLAEAAAGCEALVAMAVIAITGVSWIVAASSPTYNGVPGFVSGLLHPSVAMANIHALGQALCMMLLLDGIRQWGRRLAGPDPLGEATLHAMSKVKWLVLLLACACSFSFAAPPTVPQSGNTIALLTSIKQGSDWSFSFLPLMAGLMAALLLSIAERVAATAEVLRAENQEFV